MSLGLSRMEALRILFEKGIEIIDGVLTGARMPNHDQLSTLLDCVHRIAQRSAMVSTYRVAYVTGSLSFPSQEKR